jgi:hypothetical protein
MRAFTLAVPRAPERSCLMATDRHDNNNGSAVDGGPAMTDGDEHPARPIPRQTTGDRPVAEERRSRSELYSELRDASPAVDCGPRSGQDGPRTTNDGAWEWKGLRLEPEANRIADEELSARRSAEGRATHGSYGDHGITPGVRRVEARLEHGTLVPDTERFALKSPGRFKEKLAKLIERYPDRSPEQLSSAIHDGIRYTFIFDPSSYVTGVRDTQKKLAEKGYHLRFLKPSWDDPDYKGINSRWRDPDSGLLFEIQFHTRESWEAKQATHDIYETMADPRTTPDQCSRLAAEQRKITAGITVPKSVTEISYYSAREADE